MAGRTEAITGFIVQQALFFLGYGCHVSLDGWIHRRQVRARG
ncbi:hypothetical protein [Sulfurivirga sp.]|nr:hypothetical protein [Sulfurivirga sp.]